jgi:acyl carrier protein
MSNLEKLIELFCNVFEGDVKTDAITENTRLIEDLEFNSIGLLYMALAVEENFGVKFNNDDFVNIRTVQDVLDKIEGKI